MTTSETGLIILIAWLAVLSVMALIISNKRVLKVIAFLGVATVIFVAVDGTVDLIDQHKYFEYVDKSTDIEEYRITNVIRDRGVTDISINMELVREKQSTNTEDSGVKSTELVDTEVGKKFILSCDLERALRSDQHFFDLTKSNYAEYNLKVYRNKYDEIDAEYDKTADKTKLEGNVLRIELVKNGRKEVPELGNYLKPKK